MSPILITGATGQLGRALLATAPNIDQCLLVGRQQLDLMTPESLGDELAAISPRCIINAAAYTAVDKAETDAVNADIVNHLAVKAMAEYAEKAGIPLIHVSTDYVFDGAQHLAYLPGNTTNPRSVYGVTKVAGERALLASKARSWIVRTSWVYGEGGGNFVNTMLRLGAERSTLSIVADQIGAPTYARNLAVMIWSLLDSQPEQQIFHYTDSGVASWYDFAHSIFELAYDAKILAHKPRLLPIATADYPTPAKRPQFSLLDCRASYRLDGVPCQHWRDALKIMLVSQSQIKGGSEQEDIQERDS